MNYPTENSTEKLFLAELQQSEARFRAIFENTAVGIGILGLDRRVIDANPALCRMYGRSREELIGQTPALVTHPDDYAQSTRGFQELIAGEVDYYQSERRYVRKNGEVFWAHITMSFIRNADNLPLYIIGMILDIDDKKRAQLDLRQSEERFRATFESSAIGMGLLALDGKILRVNEAVCKISGYTAEELQQRYDHQNIYPEDLDVDRELFAELLACGRDSFEVEKRYIRKNGEVFWVRLTISAVRNLDNTIDYLVGMIEDIDAQKKMWAELQASEERFRILFDNAEMGLVLIDLSENGNQPLDDAHFNYLVANQRLNPAMLRMFGYSAEEIRNTEIPSLIYPPDQGMDKQQFRQLLGGEIDSYRIEKRFVRKDGIVFWGLLTYSLARTPDGTPRMVIGIIADINEERLAKERLAAQEAEYRLTLENKVDQRTRELKQSNQRLEEEIAQRKKVEQALAEKAAQDAITSERTRLARDLHDAVTQTLFSASLIAEVLPDLWKINPVEAERRLEELRQMTRGALAEMRTLLVELRPNSLVQIPLPDLLHQLCESLIGRARLPIEFVADGQAKIPPDVQIALYRITQEALNNIVKHAKATKVIVNLYQGDNSIRLVIIDDGSGFDLTAISPDHLGLKIMCERAESIGANCLIYSQPGEGTQISVLWQISDEQNKKITL